MANIIKRIYELQDIGKGVINSLTEDNVLKLFDSTVGQNGLQAVLNIDSILPYSNYITILSQLNLLSGTGGFINGVIIRDETISSPTSPIVEVGKFLGNTGAIGSIKFLPNQIIVSDGENLRGLEYEGDYENNFTDRTLVTKQYVDFKQKVLNLADFTTNNYTLSNIDNNTLIIVKNSSTNVTITVPTGLSSKFFCSVIRAGSGEVSFVSSGTTINTPVGLKIDLQYDQVALDQEASTNVFYLTGNSKV